MRAEPRAVRTSESPFAAALASSALLAAALVFGGCASTGEASARVVDRDGDVVPATIAWRTPSPYGAFGRMVVTLPDGTGYAGEYRLVGEQNPETAALWEPWRAGWPDWPLPWENGALPALTSVDDGDGLRQRYQGLAIANLESPSGERLRCRFGLLEPTVGLAGGMNGDCQAENGAVPADLRAQSRPGDVLSER